MANIKDGEQNSEESITTRISEKLECPICLEQLKTPKVLSCLHTFCLDCLKKLHVQESDDPHLEGQKQELKDSVVCPVCRTETQIPGNDVSNLKSNFLVTQMIEVLNLQSKAVSNETRCDICESDEVITFFCNECRYFICGHCASHHERAKVTRNHKLSSIEEAINFDSTQLVSVPKSRPKYCQKHTDDEILKFYCETCKEVICRDCRDFDHKDHQHLFIKEIAKQRKEGLCEMMDKSKKLLSNRQNAEQSIQDMIDKIRDRQNKVKDEIIEKYDVIIKRVNEHTLELFKCVDETANKKTKALDAQSLNAFLLSDAISFVGNMLKHCDDIEIMKMDSSLQGRLGDLCDSLLDVSPEEGEMINFDFHAPSVAAVCTIIDDDSTSINGHSFDPEQCSIALNETEIPLGQIVSFQITTKAKDGVICGSQFDKFEIYIKECQHDVPGADPVKCVTSGQEILCQIQPEKSHSVFNGKTPALNCQAVYHLHLSLNNVHYIRKIFTWNGNLFDVESTCQKA